MQIKLYGYKPESIAFKLNDRIETATLDTVTARLHGNVFEETWNNYSGPQNTDGSL
jgi:hypothetical protein